MRFVRRPGGLGRGGATHALIALLLLAVSAEAEQASISIDGALQDWSAVAPAYDDDRGDGGASGVDFGRVWIADDERFLYIRVEFGVEIDLSENNNLRIYLDTDASTLTGQFFGGIGAELIWRFGDRAGTFYFEGDTTSIDYNDIRFRSGPTVTGAVFEMAFGRDTLPDGAHALFQGPVVRVVLYDSPSGDLVPASGETLSYTFDAGPAPKDMPIDLDRGAPGDLRFVTYNVKNDGPWASGQEARFGRQLVAVQPDIINFQEINGHSAQQTAAFVGDWLAGPWHAAGNSDCKTISRYPILDTWALDGNLAVLIDTTPAIGRAMLVVNAHLPCCASDEGRQEEIDRIMSFVREALEPRSAIDADTPIVITGDLNLVGLAQQVDSLLTGDIVDTGSFGPDFAPDWDGSALTNLISRQTEKRMGYTWRSPTSSFWPGHLDYIIYSDSVVDVVKDFLLYTPEISPPNLAQYGLLSTDSLVSDHLLVCADFRASCAGDLDGSGAVDFADLIAVLTAWGPCPLLGPCEGDLGGDGSVGFSDLLTILSAWGPCA